MREVKVVGPHAVADEVHGALLAHPFQPFERAARLKRRFDLGRVVKEERVEFLDPQNF